MANNRKKFYKDTQRGITLIEILVVIAMFSIIAGFSLSMGVGDYSRTLGKNDVDTIVSQLGKARSQAMNNICLGSPCTEGKTHGFHIESNSFTVFQGNTYDPLDPLNETNAVGGGSTNISGLANVVFSQLSGNANTEGSILVTSGSGRSYSIDINSEGRITVANL